MRLFGLFRLRPAPHAVDFGVDITKFVGEVRKYKVDKAHPFITLDPNKCIACGRCVRTCSEILRVSALGFVYRGFKSVVRPSMEKKLLETNCISCGNCIAACPTGAIAEKLPFAKPGPWAGKKFTAICHFCSVGCELQYKVFGPDAYAAVGTADTAHNKGYLCHKGRFGYRYMLDEQRLRVPQVKGKAGLKDASWDEALDLAASKLKAVIKKHGPEAVAVFASPRLANEELYQLQKWVRAGFKSNQIGSFSNLAMDGDLDALDDMLGFTASTTTMDEFQKADVIMVVNAELTENNLVAELKIKEALKKGARLLAVNSSENPLSRIADLWLDPRRGTNTALIAGLANALIEKGRIDRAFVDARTENFAEFQATIAGIDAAQVSAQTGMQKEKFAQAVDMLARAANIVVVYGMDQCLEKSRDDVKALGNLLLLLGKAGLPGNGLILVRDYANAQGLLDMGADQPLPPRPRPPRPTGRRPSAGDVGRAPEKYIQASRLGGQAEKGRHQGAADIRRRPAGHRRGGQAAGQGEIQAGRRLFPDRHRLRGRRGPAHVDAAGEHRHLYRLRPPRAAQPGHHGAGSGEDQPGSHRQAGGKTGHGPGSRRR